MGTWRTSGGGSDASAPSALVEVVLHELLEGSTVVSIAAVEHLALNFSIAATLYVMVQ